MATSQTWGLEWSPSGEGRRSPPIPNINVRVVVYLKLRIDNKSYFGRILNDPVKPSSWYIIFFALTIHYLSLVITHATQL